jgi:predicted SnoaL-like aldol condensation-catalyzing enzyme
MKFGKTRPLVAVLALAFGCECLLAQTNTSQERKNLKVALNWWREVIAFGHRELAPRYMADDYVEHNPNVGADRAAFVAFVGKTTLKRHIQSELPKPPVIAFGKNDFVVLVWEHDDRDRRGKGIEYNTFDILRFRDGKIQEHWNGEKKDPSSSATAFEGSAPIVTQFTPTPEEQRNEEMVLNMYRDVFQYRHFELASKYMAADYIQHNPTDPQGRDKLMEELSGRFKPEPLQAEMKNKPSLAIAKGDIVLMMTTRPEKDPKDPSKTYELNHFEMVRVQNGLAQEHWDSSIGPGGARN